ncbi:hypothetical protein G7054_g1269 [Neopestalotiopsis clavispora]|nr:hypothetical protein G7054_g1269 [Neopestalotiopsis clavispora]
MHDHLVLSFFFNARGAPLESSMFGMMRSLIYQFMDQNGELSEECIQYLREKLWHEKEEDWQWQLSELSEFLLLAIHQHFPKKPVIILVDGLDECEWHQGQDMAPFLQTALNLNIDTIKVCLASRPRDYFTEIASGHLQLTLQDLTKEDIKLYIKETLTSVDENTRDMVFRNASGCFLWAAIVVNTVSQAQGAGGNATTTGADVNAKGGVYGSALQAAVCKGSTKVVRLLISEATDINAPGGQHGSALKAALYGGNDGILQLFSWGGACDDGQGNKYVGSLKVAAAISEGNEDLISRLLDRGTDINDHGGFYGNAPGGFYGHALQAATYAGNKAAVTQLWEAGVNIDAEGGYYGSALQAAASQNNLEIVSMLVFWRANLNVQGGEYGNALCAASYDGSPEIVECLLRNGADPDIRSDYYGTALQAAAYKGNLETVKLLTAHGADVNAQGGERSNALCAALVAANHDIAKHIIRHGARADLRDSFNCTASHHAVKLGSFEIIYMLLEQGASPDDFDYAQTSPLDIAIQLGNSFLVQLLFRFTKKMPYQSRHNHY